MAKYTLGIDYGTLSARAVLVDVANGNEIGAAVSNYAHGVIDDFLPSTNIRLPEGFALQHPKDYLDALNIIPKLLQDCGVDALDIVGVGVDFTSCTVMPIDKNGTPLCLLPQYQNNPHAYPKLWKHHAANKEAAQLNAIAKQRNEPFLPRYGGKISPEWALPKLWQILNEDPDLYQTMDKFVEGADWLVSQLVGKLVRNSCTAGYKAIWNKQEGFPSADFFKALDPNLETVISDKFDHVIYPLGTKAGKITKRAATITGLKPDTAVAVGIIDAHAALPAAGITKSNQYLMIMGTSTCTMILHEQEILVEGICGVVEDGIIPGFYGYESGQACVGDLFAWFVEKMTPTGETHESLTKKASQLKPGQSGLIALDWWNGNRSTLVDMDLTGMILGMDLQTTPAEIYRALIEATAFGAYNIIQAFNTDGVTVKEVFACGGIAQKNKLLMQIYADVFDMPIKVVNSEQTVAVGSAIFAAVAAGKEAGGYNTMAEATNHMAAKTYTIYTPIPKNVEAYKTLFAEYVKLYNYFGKENNVMKVLKKMKSSY